jgi:hypothetical protein
MLARDGALWFAHSRDYRIHKRTPEGDTLLVFAMPNRFMPVPRSEIDSLIVLFAAQGRPVTPANFNEYRRLVLRIVADNAGHVYVFPQEDGVPLARPSTCSRSRACTSAE